MKDSSNIKMGVSKVRSEKGWAKSGAFTTEAFPGSKRLSAKKTIMKKGTADGFAGHGRLNSAHGTTAGKQKDHPFNKNTFEGCKPKNILSKTPGGVKK